MNPVEQSFGKSIGQYWLAGILLIILCYREFISQWIFESLCLKLKIFELPTSLLLQISECHDSYLKRAIIKKYLPKYRCIPNMITLTMNIKLFKKNYFKFCWLKQFQPRYFFYYFYPFYLYLFGYVLFIFSP